MMMSKQENNHIRGFAMQQFVENDSSVVLLAHLTSAVLLLCFSKLRPCVILIFEVRMIPKLKIYHFISRAMLKLVEKDPSFVLLAHQAPEILHFMFL